MLPLPGLLLDNPDRDVVPRQRDFLDGLTEDFIAGHEHHDRSWLLCVCALGNGCRHQGFPGTGR
jgi:hypothetical protein